MAVRLRDQSGTVGRYVLNLQICAESCFHSDEGHKFLAERLPVYVLDEIRNLPKSEFFDMWLYARREFLHTGKPAIELI